MKCLFKWGKGVLMSLSYVVIFYLVNFLMCNIFLLWQIYVSESSIAQAERKLIDSTYAISVISAIFCIWLFRVIGKLRKKPLRSIIENEAKPPIINVMAVCLAFGLRFFVVVFYAFAQDVGPLRDSLVEAAYSAPRMETWGAVIVALFAVLVFMPFFEELLFRGIIMNELVGSVGSVAAVTLQAILFGVAHGVLFQSIFTAVLGVVLGIVYLRTRSIGTVTLLHCAFNLSVVIPSIGNDTTALAVYSVAGFVVSGLSLTYIIKFGRNKKHG